MRQSSCILKPFGAVVALALWVVAAPAQEFDQGPVFTLIEDNDLVVKTDRHYTQGIKLSFLHRDADVPRWIDGLSDAIPEIGFSKRVNKFGYQLGQSIYTPSDLTRRDLTPDDRPYAGWLYTGLMLHRRGLVAERWLTLESFQVDAGVIGPESLAQEAQTWIHELRGFDIAQGWDHQLKTEPGLALKYYRAIRFSPEGPAPKYFDVIPHAGFSLGNVETSLRAGGMLRLGINLPDDFGPQTISALATTEGGWSPSRQGRRWGCYAFTGFDGWIVGWNVFLNGNLFHSSHHVDPETFTGEWKSGFAFILSRIEVGFTYVYRGREFAGQPQDHGYGSVLLKTKF